MRCSAEKRIFDLELFGRRVSRTAGEDGESEKKRERFHFVSVLFFLSATTAKKN
jgi:hypothetical protein